MATIGCPNSSNILSYGVFIFLFIIIINYVSTIVTTLLVLLCYAYK